MNKSLIFLVLTCLFELLWVFGFNVAYSPWHWIVIGGVILLDFYFLSKACESLPTGTVYAIFAGAGTIGSALMDIYIFDGSFNVMKALFMLLIVAGVIMLKLSDNKDAKQKQKGAA
ncbi:paired small multidrug resistance pump [Terribacillus halophilus]|uniref:Paired small multidrug resistance pump n=1 Tax=Terribacillus halophilus TaxID=361279 RepID=A0A1G6PNW2_9BACI|nr:SMR family transporter [Terribacillus halophilus]SDC81324.1 paired small multidrug resistance pump [Terribacillus halophilus]